MLNEILLVKRKHFDKQIGRHTNKKNKNKNKTKQNKQMRNGKALSIIKHHFRFIAYARSSVSYCITDTIKLIISN